VNVDRSERGDRGAVSAQGLTGLVAQSTGGALVWSTPRLGAGFTEPSETLSPPNHSAPWEARDSRLFQEPQKREGKPPSCPLASRGTGPVPHVGIISFENGKISPEHIYWDQAKVLRQMGLLNTSLPVVGNTQCDRLLDANAPVNQLIEKGVPVA
jgi:hypothetical protein